MIGVVRRSGHCSVTRVSNIVYSFIGDYIGEYYYRAGDTTSLDYSPCCKVRVFATNPGRARPKFRPTKHMGSFQN